jgi:uncharacterized iron-regulated protein
MFADDYQIFSKKTQTTLTLKELSIEISNYNVIFFGEFHENAILHKLEMELLQNLWNYYPDLAVSFEMFERDVQNVLDDYLAGRISEDELLKNSRPWGNYLSDYKPLIEFAKDRKLPVIAANVPRDYAAFINKDGIKAFYNLPNKQFAAEKFSVHEGKYKEKFYQTMLAMSESSPMMKKSLSDEKLYNLYAAQCLKDETMAESIHLFQQIRQECKILHYNGDFHSNSYLGTVEKLKALNSTISIAVITPIIVESDFVFPIAHIHEADFFIVIKKR